ncbi:hypothetical protein [Actinomadura sp. B10D3]|uniref:nSTAND1 domain-containing NTPase n=1 Tax=Actinomadura sp. B10D3 TaxID=3153557 RepID=UPI00325EA219
MSAGSAGPWVGLRPFGRDDENTFFGRDAEIGAVAGLWRRRRLTLLVGDAGVGKTSLLHAGLVPSLLADGSNVLPVGDPGYRHTLPAPLVPTRSPALFALLASWQPHVPAAGIVGLTAGEFISRKARHDASGRPVPTLVAIDGVDHILRGDAAERPVNRRLLIELSDVLRDRPEVHLLLSVRPGSVAGTARIVDVLHSGEVGRFDLGPLGRSGAIDALRKPAVAIHRGFDAGEPARLVDALRVAAPGGAAGAVDESSVEPVLLQVLCVALWEQLSERAQAGSTITADAVPDVERVLAEHCMRTLDRLTSDHNLPTCEIGTWLRRTFAATPGAVVAAGADGRPAEIDETVLRAVEDRHLIRASVSGGEEFHRLLHPCLAAALRRLGEVRVDGPVAGPPDLLDAAGTALKDGNLDLAERQARAAISRAGQVHDARSQARGHEILGEIAYARAKHDQAVTAYREAISLHEALGGGPGAGFGDLWAAIARLRLLDGAPGDAVGEIRVAGVQGADRDIVKLILAQAKWHVGRTWQGVEELNQVLARHRGHDEALRIRGEIYADAGDAAAALGDLEPAARTAGPSAMAARVLALAMGRGDEVPQEELDELLAEDPDNGLVLLSIARLMHRRGDRDRTAQLVSRALRATNPRLSSFHREKAEELV